MKQHHEELKARIPEYLSGKLSETRAAEVTRHLENCSDCRGELSIIEGINKAVLPDPGELFWGTLPVKVKTLSQQEQKSGFTYRAILRPYPVMAVIFLLVIGIFLSTQSNFSYREIPDPSFQDPLSASFTDLETISDEELREITYRFSIDDLNIYDVPVIYYRDSYHGELASMSSEEVTLLYQRLNTKLNNGGV